MSQSNTRLITILVISIIAVTDMATDIFVPTLPDIVAFFSITERTVTWTLSLTLIGYCVSAPLFGPYSDAYGRRSMFVVGLLIYTVGSLMCAFSSSITALLVGRFIVGIGTAVGYVVGVAVVRDLFKREEFSKTMSYIHIVVSIAPAVAPIFGSYIGEYFGWQANFFVLSVAAIVMLYFVVNMPESHPENKRTQFNWGGFVRDYVLVLSNPIFLSFSFISAIVYAGLWLYIAEIPHIFEDLGVPGTHFGYYQAFLVLIFMVGAYANSALVERIGLETIFKYFINLTLVGSAMPLLAAIYAPESSYAICGSMAVFCCGLGGVFGNAATYAMDEFPDNAGTAASALASIEHIVPAVVLVVMSWFFNQTPMPLAIGLLSVVSIAYLLYLCVKNKVATASHSDI